MRIWKIPDQVLRVAVVLAVAIAVLVAARIKFVPESFGDEGHYRAAAVPAIASQEIRYAGWQLCVECHDTEGEVKQASYHRLISCEVCHGAAVDHAEDPESRLPEVPRARGESCLYCHSYLQSRPTGFPQIIEALHNPMEPCIECHDPHDPIPPHTPETCAACHGQIARTKAVSHHATLDCETCHEALPEHRQSPRSFLPRKPASREFCGGCHARGAESLASIPRIDPGSHGGTYSCWQCHYPHHPEG